MAMPRGRGEYQYDYDRTDYQYIYYIANRHRRNYTYVKKGVMKRLPDAQYNILSIVRKDKLLYSYCGEYRYFENGVYHQVNRKSVECLITSEHLELSGTTVKITQKGLNHKQSQPKNPCIS